MDIRGVIAEAVQWRKINLPPSWVLAATYAAGSVAVAMKLMDWSESRLIAEAAESLAASALTIGLALIAIVTGMLTTAFVADKAGGRIWVGTIAGLSVAMVVAALGLAVIDAIPGVGWRIAEMWEN